jgi:hypothetical protein
LALQFAGMIARSESADYFLHRRDPQNRLCQIDTEVLADKFEATSRSAGVSVKRCSRRVVATPA